MTIENIFSRLQRLISEQFSVDEKNVTMEAEFEEDFGADSVDLMELVMAVEEEFDLEETQEDELDGLKTVEDVVQLICNKLNAN